MILKSRQGNGIFGAIKSMFGMEAKERLDDSQLVMKSGTPLDKYAGSVLKEMDSNRSDSEKYRIGRNALKEIRESIPDRRVDAVAKAGLKTIGKGNVQMVAVRSCLETFAGSLNSPVTKLLADTGLRVLSSKLGTDTRYHSASFRFAKEIKKHTESGLVKELFKPAGKARYYAAKNAVNKAAFRMVSAGVQGPAPAALAQAGADALSELNGYTQGTKTDMSKAYMKSVNSRIKDPLFSILMDKAGKVGDSAVESLHGVIFKEVASGKTALDRDDLLKMGKSAANAQYVHDFEAVEAMEPFFETLSEVSLPNDTSDFFQDILEINNSAGKRTAMAKVLNEAADGILLGKTPPRILSQKALDVLNADYYEDKSAVLAAAPFVENIFKSLPSGDHRTLLGETLTMRNNEKSARPYTRVVLEEIARPSGLKGRSLYVHLASRLCGEKFEKSDHGKTAMSPLLQLASKESSNPMEKSLVENLVKSNDDKTDYTAFKNAVPFLKNRSGGNDTSLLAECGIKAMQGVNASPYNRDELMSRTAVPYLKTLDGKVKGAWKKFLLSNVAGLYVSSDNSPVGAHKEVLELVKSGKETYSPKLLADTGLKAMDVDARFERQRYASGRVFLETIGRIDKNQKIRAFVGGLDRLEKWVRSENVMRSMLSTISDYGEKKCHTEQLWAEAGLRALDSFPKKYHDDEKIKTAETLLGLIQSSTGSDELAGSIQKVLNADHANRAGKIKAYTKMLKALSPDQDDYLMKASRRLAGKSGDSSSKVVEKEKEIIIDGVRLGVNRHGMDYLPSM